MSVEAMKQALEALEDMAEFSPSRLERQIIAIREALAQPEQEPLAWLIWLHGPAGHFDHKQFAEMEFERRNKEYPDPDRKLLPLYTAPPQPEPVIDKSAAIRIATSLGWEPKRKPPQFPTMLRKMWSGTEVQEWINENWSNT